MTTLRRTGRPLGPARDAITLDEETMLRLVVAIVHRAELDVRSRNRKLRRAARRWLTMMRKGATHGRS